MELEEHYGPSVDLKMQDQRVDIVIEYTDDQGPCPECGAICPKHDDRKKCTWRHLDTMQFSTYLYCEVPRVRCDTHGAKTVAIPWAGKNSRFTLLFEAFAIRVLTAARSVEEARKLLGLNWHQAEAIVWLDEKRQTFAILVLMKSNFAQVIAILAISMIWMVGVCLRWSKSEHRKPVIHS